jgi:hypothetical protein
LKEFDMEQAIFTVSGTALNNLDELKNSLTAIAYIKLEARTAQRLVTKWVVDHVGNLLCGDTPLLVNTGDKFYWRVPVVLGSTRAGLLGQAGTIDVDAETGKLLINSQLAGEILENAQTLIRST